MQKTHRLALLSLAAITVSLTVLLILGGGRGEAGDAPRIQGPELPNQANPGVLGQAEPGLEAARRPGPARDEPEPQSPELARIRGRCVDERGKPLSGCRAALKARYRTRRLRTLHGDTGWKNPPTQVTRADGRFEWAFRPRPGLMYSILLRHDERAPRHDIWSTMAAGRLVELGDVVMTPGFRVHGRVLDEEGSPVANATVSVRGLALGIGAEGGTDQRAGWTKESGEFEVQDPIPPGTWPLDIGGEGLRLVRPHSVTVPRSGTEPLRVTVRRMPSIRGVVVDEQGTPVEGVSIRAILGRSGRIPADYSDENGAFELFAVDEEPKPVKVKIADAGPCEPTWKDERLWPWGTRGLRIVLKRALEVDLTVVEAATGAPVTDYSYECFRKDASGSERGGTTRRCQDAKGRTTVTGVWRGTNFLRVIPQDESLQPVFDVEFEGQESGTAPLQVALHARLEVKVRLSTESGEPVSGSRVEVVRKGTHRFAADSHVLDARRGHTGPSTNPRFRFHRMLGTAESDQAGRARLWIEPSARDVAIRITGPEHAVTLVDSVAVVPGREIEIEVAPAGRIVGEVLRTGLDPTKMQVVPERADGTRLPRSIIESGRVKRDGTFAISGLAPGVHRIELRYDCPYRSPRGGSGATIALEIPTESIHVRAGSESRITIDARHLAFAEVRGRVLIDGVVASPARLFLLHEKSTRFGVFAPSETAAVVAKELLPGKYRAALITGDFQAGPGHTIFAADTFRLASGQRLERDFHFVRQRLVVRVVHADGKTPASGIRVDVMAHDSGPHATTDSMGVAVFDPALATKLEVRGAAKDGSFFHETLELPPGVREHRVTLRLRRRDGR